LINLGFLIVVTGIVVVVAVVILVSLFSVQHYGTDRVGWLFAPIVFLWFLFIASIGMFNIWKHDPSVLKAFSPVYIFRYFKRGGQDRWTSLGGIMLSITGKETDQMFIVFFIFYDIHIFLLCPSYFRD
jgi:KUP system potassium uptake protein